MQSAGSLPDPTRQREGATLLILTIPLRPAPPTAMQTPAAVETATAMRTSTPTATQTPTAIRPPMTMKTQPLSPKYHPPAVEHKHVKKQHETREQTFVHKDKHQDHYHTTIQPLKDSETLPEKHDRTQDTRRRSINNDHSDAKKKAEASRSGFKNTSDQEQFETKTREPTQQDVHVHNHWHETVQPVIEKGESNCKE